MDSFPGFGARGLVGLRELRQEYAPGGIETAARLSLRSAAPLNRERIGEVIYLALHTRPFDRLIIVATPDQHFSVADRDDNITFGGIAVTLYPHFDVVFSGH